MPLGLLLGALGIRLRVEVNLEAAQRMAHRWEKKHTAQVRTHTRLSKQILELAKPINLSQAARKRWETRRRQAQRHNGRANGHTAGL